MHKLSEHSPDGRRFHPNLVRFGVFDKPDEPPPFVDRRRAGQLLAERRKMPNFLSSRRTSPSAAFCRRPPRFQDSGSLRTPVSTTFSRLARRNRPATPPIPISKQPSPD